MVLWADLVVQEDLQLYPAAKKIVGALQDFG